MRMRTVIVTLLCLFFGVVLQPAATGQRITNILLSEHVIRLSIWRESHGLPTWHIRDMVEDHRGLVWLATDVGLASLDGIKFINRNVAAPGVEPEQLHRVAEDAQHNIWLFYLSSDSLAIFIYDPYQDHTIPVEDYLGRPLHFSSETVRNIFRHGSAIWILDPVSGRGGRFGADGKWEDCLFDQIQRESDVRYFPARDGNFWMFSPQKQQIVRIGPYGTAFESFSCAHLDIADFSLSSQGDLYLLLAESNRKDQPVSLYTCLQGAGLKPLAKQAYLNLDWGNSVNAFDNTFPAYGSNKTGMQLVLQHDGAKLYHNNQLLYDRLASYMTAHHNLNLENAVCTSRDGSFWMIAPGALIRLEALHTPFTNYLNDIPVPPSTKGLATLGNKLYANTTKGHFQIDLDARRWKRLPCLEQQFNGLGIAARNGQIWFAHAGKSVGVFDPESGKYQTLQVRGPREQCAGNAFYFLPDNSVLLGTDHGIFRRPPAAAAFEPWTLENLEVYCFYADKAGRLWAGTSEGIVGLDESGFPILSYLKGNTPNQRPVAVYHIHEDANGLFWLATNLGLWRWQSFTSQVTQFTRENSHLPSNRIYAVYEDAHGRLWLSSNAGLICFNKIGRRVETYFARDGLPSDEMNRLAHWRDEQGKLYFGGISGVMSFLPDSITVPKVKALAIELISLNFSSLSRKKSLNQTRQALFSAQPVVVAPWMDRLTLQFTSLNFSRELLQYKWRIPEQDTTWHLLSEPLIDIFHPPYGRYTLEMEVVRVGDNWDEAGRLRIPLWVQKPYYLQSWFFILVVASLLALIFLVFRHRQQRLRWLNARLAGEVAEKTAQLQRERDIIARQAETLRQLDEEKTQFFQDVSHEIRNPLTLILGPVNDMLRDTHLPEQQVENLQRVKRNAQKILRLVEEVMEMTKLEAGIVTLDERPVAIHPFVAHVFLEFTQLAKQKRIALRLQNDLPSAHTVLLDTRKLEKILSNLLHNALKFTPAGGTIVLRAGMRPDGQLAVQVQDTGIGIAPEHLERIFDRHYRVPKANGKRTPNGFGIGLAMSKSYVRLMHGEIKAESVPGQGTIMSFSIPCREIIVQEAASLN